jgi:hypothetical protein
VELLGKHYESVSQASRELNIKEKIITIRLKNGEPGYVITGKKVQGYTPVIIDNIEYESINAVVDAGLAKNRYQVMRRLKNNNKFPNWVYKFGPKNSGPAEDFPFDI